MKTRVILLAASMLVVGALAQMNVTTDRQQKLGDLRQTQSKVFGATQLKGEDYLQVMQPNASQTALETKMVTVDELLGKLPSYGPVGAKMVYGLSTSNQVKALFLGDSMSEMTSRESISYKLANQLKSMFGDAGRGGMGWHHGYGTTFNRTNATTRYLNVPGEVRGSDGTNALSSVLKLWHAPSREMNRFGLWMEAGPNGGKVWVRHASASAGVDRILGEIDGYSATSKIIYTNWPVNSADDHYIYLTAEKTNICIGPEWVNTNAPGLLDFWYSKGGSTINSMLACGAQQLSNMFKEMKPEVVIWHSKHFDSGNTISNLNYVLNLVSNASPGCAIAVVGSQQSQTYKDHVYNPLLKELCRTNGWQYIDLWSAFPSYDISYKYKLMTDGLHPTDIGASVMMGEVARQLGFYYWPNMGSVFNGKHVGDGSALTNVAVSGVIKDFNPTTPHFYTASLHGWTNNAAVGKIWIGGFTSGGIPAIWTWQQAGNNTMMFDLTTAQDTGWRWRNGYNQMALEGATNGNWTMAGNLTISAGKASSVLTNASCIWLVTNNVPNGTWPPGSICTRSDTGDFYVFKSGTWNVK